MALHTIGRYHRLPVCRFYRGVFMADKGIRAFSFQVIRLAFAKPEQKIGIRDPALLIIAGSQVGISFLFIPDTLRTGRYRHGFFLTEGMEDGRKSQTTHP